MDRGESNYKGDKDGKAFILTAFGGCMVFILDE
jgi:hypothetical protein